MNTETETVKEIINDVNRGNEIGQKLGYNTETKKIQPISVLDDPDKVIGITPEDATLAATEFRDFGRIVLSGEIIEKLADKMGPNDVYFDSWDDGDVYNLLQERPSPGAVPGTIHFSVGPETIPVSGVGKAEDFVRVIILRNDEKFEDQPTFDPGSSTVAGYVLHETEWKHVPVTIVPVRKEIFSRFGGLLETDILSKKQVFIAGEGSFGSVVTIELVKSGITILYFMDHDRLEVGNISRHFAGLTHVGRLKTKVMDQLIKEVNPYARNSTFEEKVSWDNIDKVRDIIRKADLVICTTDDRPSRLIINRVCVEEATTCIFAAAFRRAYGGQILRVRPHESLCYQCYCMYLPKEAEDQEVSNPEQAEGLAYTDRPVAIEPGLSTDIAPITTMVAKLAIQELMKGKKSTLQSVDDDLVAPWYLWLNRREVDTQYEDLEPLEFNVDGMHILRWYGIDVKRHPGCPVCGDFEHLLVKHFGIELPISSIPGRRKFAA